MFSPKTLSFWLALLGSAAALSRRPKVFFFGIGFLAAVGWGGFGGSYYRYAERHSLPVEPYAVARHWLETGGDMEEAKSAGKHVLFAAIAAVIVWRRLLP